MGEVLHLVAGAADGVLLAGDGRGGLEGNARHDVLPVRQAPLDAPGPERRQRAFTGALSIVVGCDREEKKSSFQCTLNSRWCP